jgi:radical SAM protein with 4Fe4S-binding SPASM domain
MLIDKNTFSFKKLRNRFRASRSYTAARSVNSAEPIEIIIEITNNCNLDCIMCPRLNMARPEGYMELEMFQSIIDQVKEYAELVYLSGGLGDPLLHPKYAEMVRYAVENDVRLGVSTNATMLTSKNIDMLLSAEPDLILLSLDGARKETHEKIRVGSKFERTMAGVENLLHEKERRGLSKPYTVCQMVYMPENQDEADEFREKWGKFAAVDDVRLKKFLFLQGADYGAETEADAPDHSKWSCILPWRQLSIGFDGTVALCCRDYDFTKPVGNVKDTPIKDIWNSEKMLHYRECLATERKSELSTCKDCRAIRTNAFTRLGAIMLDDYSIRKILPVLEQLVIKTGMKLTDYE